MEESDKIFKSTRDYFERGCRCIHEGRLDKQTTDNDEHAVYFYLEFCECTRNFDREEYGYKRDENF